MAGVVEALAEFGAAQRIAALEAGERTWLPSARRSGSRRKAR